MKHERIPNQRVDYQQLLKSILRLTEVMFIGFASFFVSCKANEIAKAQLHLMQAESMPAFHVIERQIPNADGIIDTHMLIISNESGYLTNYESEHISFVRISYGQRHDCLIPLTGIWRIGFHTQNTTGELERRGFEGNYSKFRLLFEEASKISKEQSPDSYNYIWDYQLETYVKISFYDITQKPNALYFSLSDNFETSIIDQETYDSLFATYNALSETCIFDINASSPEDVIQTIFS